jgi:RNA-splicing ligase RtcB
MPIIYCKGKGMDSRQFAELHAQCWETLKHYVHEADRMCELFGQCLPDASSIQFRSDIVEQRVREHNAYASYVEIRRQLLEAVRVGYDRPS